ncbi:MAG: adenylate/guanylate cyclase domain-containing protein [Nitrospirota bacterium]|mgnify:CR=1 FL=1
MQSVKKISLSIAVIFTALFSILQIYNPAIIRDNIGSKIDDFRFFIRGNLAHTDILIVTVDEKSIREIGRWPWNRKTLAELVRQIHLGKPKVLGIDIMLSEREISESDLPDNPAMAGKSDALLAGAMKKDNTVLAVGFFVTPGHGKPQNVFVPDFLPDHSILNIRDFKLIKPVEAENVLSPLPEFAENTVLGHVYCQPDTAGVLRHEILYLKYADEFYPSFALQVSRIALGLKMQDLTVYPLKGVKLGEILIPTDATGNGRMQINYLGKEKTFEYISASDVLKGNIPHKVFKDRIVLLGTSAIATYDQKVTPLSANMPGVEKNATVIDNIITGRFIRESYDILMVFVILITGLLLGFISPRLKAIPCAAISGVLVFLYLAVSQYFFEVKGFSVSIIYPVSNIVLIFVATTVVKYFFEEKYARQIKNMFSSYVSPAIVDELIKFPEKLRLGGEKKVLTVLFADIKNFTSFSEKHTPEEVVIRLNEYLTEMTNIIFRWRGTLDKFVGDAVVAFWGAPLEQPEHAELAIRCAIHMSNRLRELQEKWKSEGKEILDAGIGLNTGEVLVGNIGAMGKKMDYTVIGDNVNLASRIEGLSRDYDVRVLISGATYEALEKTLNLNRTGSTLGHAIVKKATEVKVRGREQGIVIYEVKPLEHDS